uniref:SH3 and multiple ankyrin repeat domains 3 n=1 Tax=Hucho hucho TaxID=62062 RepID=A0A4W5M7S3_9TELE
LMCVCVPDLIFSVRVIKEIRLSERVSPCHTTSPFLIHYTILLYYKHTHTYSLTGCCVHSLCVFPAETPIEEFTPTPAFPALQYLESVDVEGVAWRAGLRTGDFLIEVHGVNVVKVGHKQVVSLIRQGGNSLLMKVVSVTRKPESEEVVRKKAPPPPKRAPSTTLTLRSKSMTAELEELGYILVHTCCVAVFGLCCLCDPFTERLDEMLAPQEPVMLRSQPTEADYRAATVKQRPTGRRITQSEISVSIFTHTHTHTHAQKQNRCIFSRPPTSSMTDSLRDHSHSHSIPPPPQTAPPPPPSLYFLDTGPPPAFCPPPPPARGHGQGHDPGGRSSFKPSSLDLDRPYDPSPRQSSHAERQKKARSMIILQDSSHLPVEPTDIPRPSASATPPERIKRKGRVIDNPYANVGQFSIGLYTPTKPQRKKSPLVKQLQVEDAQERASIALAAAHSREPSPSGRHTHTHGHTHTSRADYYQQQLMVERERMRLQGEALLQGKGPFAAAIAGAVKDRERRLEERRKSTVFQSVGTMEGGSGSAPEPPSYTTSRSIDERLLSRELGQLPPPALALRPSPGGTTFIHPLTGKPLDPNSPLALALAARERALTSQSQSPASSPEPRTKQDRAGVVGQGASLFIESQTKEPQHGGRRLGRTEDKKSMLISIIDTSQQKTAGLIMVHATSNGQAVGLGPGLEQTPTSPATEPSKPSLSRTLSPSPSASQPQGPSSPAQAPLAQGSSEEDVEPYTVSLPPAMLSSSDEETREELKKIGVLPPPDEFANGLLANSQAQVQGTPVPQSKSTTSPTTPTLLTPSTTTPTPSLTPTSTDSGVEEADTRSSSERERDHHLETTSTVSTVSSMSTLSSESGEPADTHTSYADGQTFVLDKPPVPPKPRLKSHIGGSKGPVTFRDPLLKQSSDSELLSQQPRYLFQRRSKLWGDQMEARGPGVGLGMGSLGSLGGLGLGLGGEEGGKPSVMGELSSRLHSLGELHTISQRSYGTTYTIRPGSRFPVTRRTPSPGSGSPDRGDPLSRIPGFGLPTSPTMPHHTILKPFHQKPLHLWNKYDVGDWLESINLGEHRTGFQEHEIEGSHLPALTKDDFAELGVTRVGHRMNIERALKQLLES